MKAIIGKNCIILLSITIILICQIKVNSSQIETLRNLDANLSTLSNTSGVVPEIQINITIINNTKVYQDVLQVYIYNSSLTHEQRNEYLYWVNYKNSFNSDTVKLAKMTKYFAPESPTYFNEISNCGWPFYTLGGLFTFALVYYLIVRFLLGWFLGPKQHVTHWFAYFSYALIFFGFCLMLIFFAMSLSNSSKIHSSVEDVTKHLIKQADLMSKTVISMKTEVEILTNLSYKTNVTDYMTTIYKYESINNETLEYSDKAKTFSDHFLNTESSRYNYEIACIILIPLLTIGFLVAFKLKKSVFILIMSLLLFSLIVPACVILGMNTSFFILSIDFCKDINKYITSEVSPYAEKGIGVYISCPSKTTQIMINTAKYELGNSFNKVIEEVNNTLISSYLGDIGIYKRNNSRFEYIARNYVNNTNLNKGLYSLIHTNNILTGLNALSECQFADDNINYIEEKFCYRNITLQFNNLIYYFLGILGLFLLAIGANKLIVLLSPVYQKLQNKNGLELLNETFN